MTLLADSLDVARTAAGGFDGIAIYDNYVEPPTWPGHAQDCTARGLLFSFNMDPGYDGIVERRSIRPRATRRRCSSPGAQLYDWARAADREAAASASAGRIRRVVPGERRGADEPAAGTT